MPKLKTQGHTAAIDAFIVSAEKLIDKASPHEDTPLYYEGKTYHEYLVWNEEIRSYFHKNHMPSRLPQDFFVGERIMPPYRPTGLRFDLSKDYTQSRQYRQELCEAIKYQISTLKIIRNSLSGTKVVVIHIEKDGTIWRDPKGNFSHLGKSSSKRAQMLRLFVGKNVYITTDFLTKKLKYNSPAVLAKEKRNTNEVLKKKLELEDDIILGGPEGRGRGYRINPIYSLKAD